MSPVAPLGCDSFLRLHLFLVTMTASRSTSWGQYKMPLSWNLIFSHNLIGSMGSWEEQHRSIMAIFIKSYQEYILSTCGITVEVNFDPQVRQCLSDFSTVVIPSHPFPRCTPWIAVTMGNHTQESWEWRIRSSLRAEYPHTSVGMLLHRRVVSSMQGFSQSFIYVSMDL